MTTDEFVLFLDPNCRCDHKSSVFPEVLGFCVIALSFHSSRTNSINIYSEAIYVSRDMH